MIYRFEQFELDRSKVELRRDGGRLPVEPQVFALLLLLLENRERMVSRGEIVEKVWDGRVVSESALDSRVKSARRAVGDDGKAQRLIRTVHGRGFRFVGEVTEVAPAGGAAGPGAATIASASLGSADRSLSCELVTSSDETTAPLQTAGPSAAGGRADRRPSIAVLPFRQLGSPGPHSAIADALADELIAELSRLRWLFVIARGSSFHFRSASPEPASVGALLGARYYVSGSVEVAGSALSVTVQLVDTRDGGVIWGERFASRVEGVHETRGAILARVVAALELQIPLHEARAALAAPPGSLDAWSAYHLGLQHMFRFNRADNAQAGELFTRAIAADPRFARAHAGLSFVHFQDAFLRYTGDPAAAARQARQTAERAVELDSLDPFANLTMGRSHWLEGDLDGSALWLDRATALSPSYAQAIYARAWTHALSGRGEAGKGDADLAMALSPLDPLHYAMAATRALSHVACDESAEAAAWAETAARSPGAHVLIAVVATAAHELHGDRARAAAWASNARARDPRLTAASFFRSFPFGDERVKQRIARALGRQGF